MGFDRSDVNRIMSLDSNEFKKRLENALKLSGVEKGIGDAILRDPERIRKAISGLSDGDLRSISATLRKKELGNIEAMIKEAFEK
jgi:replication-associated recombination protein RarA